MISLVPDKEFVQTSHIISIGVTNDSTYVSLGLKSGTIVLYNIKAGKHITIYLYGMRELETKEYLYGMRELETKENLKSQESD